MPALLGEVPAPARSLPFLEAALVSRASPSAKSTVVQKEPLAQTLVGPVVACAPLARRRGQGSPHRPGTL